MSDKRLLVFEGEFARVLRVCGRDGNTLSAVIRNAWDTGDLRTLTKNSPAQATGAHVSIIGHIMRLACVYALLDRSPTIRREHLEAALALWDYAEASVEYIFGARMGDPVADKILNALLNAPNGLTRTDISALFGGHQRSANIDRALDQLKSTGNSLGTMFNTVSSSLSGAAGG